MRPVESTCSTSTGRDTDLSAAAEAKVLRDTTGKVMTLDAFLADMYAKAAIARETGDVPRAKELEEAATKLDAAYKAHQAAEGKKVDLFIRAEQIDRELGRIVLEPHETASELGAGPAWAAVERLNAALARCQELLRGR